MLKVHDETRTHPAGRGIKTGGIDMKKALALMLASAILLGAVPAFAENEVPEDDGLIIIEETEELIPATGSEAEAAIAPLPDATEKPGAEVTEAATEAAVEITEAPAPEPAAEYTAPKVLNITYDGIKVNFDSLTYIDDNGIAMVPIKPLAEYIGFKVSFDTKYNTEVLSLGKNYIFFNLGTAYTTAFGNDLYAAAPTIMWGDKVYVSLRTFADIIGSELDVTDYGESMTINMRNSTYVNDYFRAQPVNPWGISSRTGYMVWVSLSQYTVRLYEGKQYMWKLIHECPCAIGAPGTPTVTGSFEYKYRTQWNYDGYYVGPCLVFYNGYALHSVLLRYNNTEYDGRTGVRISHGCVRMKKRDIDLIARTIPVGTRIYITP